MAVYSDTNEVEGDVLQPKALVLPRIADCTAAAFKNGEQGTLAFDINATKLGFITSSGVSEETITSA